MSAIRSVKVDDTKAPTFVLKGDAHMTLQCGHGYVEPGWEAWDTCYGNITPEVKVDGYPNGWVAGSTRSPICSRTAAATARRP